MPKKNDKDDLYAMKRKMLKEKRMLRNQILGTDTVDGTSMQRFYGESTKTRRALKIEFFGSKSKASATEGEETSIERFVREILEEANVSFKEQKAIRYVNVDFFLLEQKAVIQVHGCYWHACTKCYPDGPKNDIQRKNIEKDVVANQFIADAGYKLIEIWHHEINEDPDAVKERIIKEVT